VESGVASCEPRLARITRFWHVMYRQLIVAQSGITCAGNCKHLQSETKAYSRFIGCVLRQHVKKVEHCEHIQGT